MKLKKIIIYGLSLFLYQSLTAQQFDLEYYKGVDPQYHCEVLSDTMYVFIPYPSVNQVMLPAGGNAMGSGGSVSYSFGQLSNKKSSGPNETSTDGIQNPFEIMVITGFEIKDVPLDITVYPNPATSFLILQTDLSNYNNPGYRLYDELGKCLNNNAITETKTNIPVNGLKPSTYFLKVYDGSKEIKTFKIIKN